MKYKKDKTFWLVKELVLIEGPSGMTWLVYFIPKTHIIIQACKRLPNEYGTDPDLDEDAQTFKVIVGGKLLCTSSPFYLKFTKPVIETFKKGEKLIVYLEQSNLELYKFGRDTSIDTIVATEIF